LTAALGRNLGYALAHGTATHYTNNCENSLHAVIIAVSMGGRLKLVYDA
jgi:hypothetical protein